MLKIFTVLLTIITMNAYAGEYTDYCYGKGLHKQDVYGCLYGIKEKTTNELDKLFRIIQKESVSVFGEGSEYIHTKKEFEMMTYEFYNYVRKQCGLMGSSTLGTGAGNEEMDCEIKLLKSRLNDVKYLFNQHYKE